MKKILALLAVAALAACNETPGTPAQDTSKVDRMVDTANRMVDTAATKMNKMLDDAKPEVKMSLDTTIKMK